MGAEDFLRADPPAGPALGASRARVLATVRGARHPLGVDEIAGLVDLHPNTTRFHLDALVERGLVARATEERDTPGRPRALYTATADSSRTGRRSYRLLAEILTSYLASHSEEPSRSAIEAGEAWGRFLTRRPAPFRSTDGATATRQLVEVLDGVGFAPEAVDTEAVDSERAGSGPAGPGSAGPGWGCRILLHHCPFREAAEVHQDVVCAVHLGLARGVLSELDAPLEVERLDPFVEPDLCVTRLGPRAGAG